VVEHRKAGAPRRARAASQDAEVAGLRLSAFRFLLFFFLSFFLSLVARMERSEIRERIQASWSSPDFASLHPGYFVRRA
jgi:hypothetical protein